jgi:hypothetical protein
MAAMSADSAASFRHGGKPIADSARQTDGAIAQVGVRRSPGYGLVFGSA